MRVNRIHLIAVIGLIATMFVIALPATEASPSAHTYPGVGYATAILPDGDLLWVGTHSGELIRIELLSGTIQRFSFPSRGVPIRKLARDSRGRTWAATQGGGTGTL